jgi:hypothetical protein
MTGAGNLSISDKVRTAFAPIVKVLDPARRELAKVKDVVTVRPGYHYPATGQPVPAVVVAVTPGTTPVTASELAQKFGVPFSVAEATVEEQLAAAQKGPAAFAPAGAPPASTFETLLTGAALVPFAPPKSGAYEPLDPPDLPLVDEPMRAIICVSPEAGWGELEAFLAGTQERLTVAMYQFTAPHIFDAVSKAVTPAGRTFKLVLHPVPEKPPANGVKAHDLNEQTAVLDPLTKALKNRFEFSWATLFSRAHPDGLWASAYHIKVAVRDGKTFWLSSGNWQSSNQPDVHPFDKGHDKLPPGFQRNYNRDYHAIIENEKLASAYETYIQRDHQLTSAQGKPEPFVQPDLFVPEDVPAAPVDFAAPPQLFPPLRLNRRVKVQPLLTPDNYAENALKLIRSAKKSVLFQNQYINFRGTSEDFNELRLLVQALKAKIDDGLDVRIICRDMMTQESLDVLVALGFPREVMRFQPACHNKTIIVDGEVVMFGSHNWSNEGVKTNRDASLIFFDQEIAEYLAQVHEHDWERLATAKPTPKRPRVAKEGEAAPKGHKRVPFSAVFED